MNIIKFDSNAALPAYLTGASNLDVNKEVIRAAAFPALSIKGMKFTINKDGVKRVITKPDDPDEVAQSINVVFLRANLNAKTFFAKKYSEGDSDHQRPDCYSFDGIAPSPNATAPQAKKCALCPHNQWGSRTGDDGEAKGKSCQDNARIAVSAPDNIDPMLLRVPPKSLKPLRETLKLIAARKLPYNAAVIKLGFDRDAPSPVLTFKPVGLMDEAGYGTVQAVYDGELVRGIVGLDDEGFGVNPAEARKTHTADADELDAALAAREVAKKASTPPVSASDLDDLMGDEPASKPTKPVKPKPAPKAVVEDEDDIAEEAPPPKAEKPAPKAAKPKPAGNDLLSSLDDLLGNSDD